MKSDQKVITGPHDRGSIIARWAFEVGELGKRRIQLPDFLALGDPDGRNFGEEVASFLIREGSLAAISFEIDRGP